MKIGIDISRANNAARTGVESYVFHIFAALQAQKREEDTIVAYVRETLVSDISANPTTNVKILLWPPKALWTQLRLSAEMLLYPVDALFVPGHVLPFILPKKALFMVHDIAAAKYPEVFSHFERWYTLWSVRFAIAKGATIIVPSEYTKREIQAVFPSVKDAQLHVTTHGIAPYTGSLQAVAALEGTPFFLVVGRKEHKKNCLRIIDAFSNLETDAKLVFVGGEGYGYEDIAKAIDESPKKEDILELGFVSEAQKQWLYQHALALVFPSLYEGFGFPAFEALLAGCPVITSKHSPMEEFLAEFVTLVEPTSTQEIVAALDAHKSERRAVNSEVVKELCARFTWKSAAQKIITLLS